MNQRKIASTILVLVLIAGMVLSFSPIAHAILPVVNNQATGNNSNSSTLAVALTVTSAGDLMVAVVQTADYVNTNTVTVSSSDGAIWAQSLNVGTWNYDTVPGYYGYLQIWYATAKSSGSITITTTLNTHTVNTVITNTEFDVGPANLFAGLGASCSATGQATLAICNTPVSFTGDTFLVGAEYGGGLCTCNAGPGFTETGVGTEVEYAVQVSGSGVTSPTSFPFTNANALSTTKFWGMGGTIFLFSSTVATVQTQTIGTCTASATGGTYLANSTQYWYAGNALGQEIVNTVQTQVENIKGSGSHTLQFVIYATTNNPAAQSPSIQYPALLVYSASFIISSGTTNSTITVNTSVPLNTAVTTPLPFNYWAVGIVGDDHIRIHNSAVSGLVTQTGAASTATQPSQFTGPGSASAVKLALCATGQYQSVVTGPVTTTTASATSTAFTTLTSTINTIGPSLFSTQSNWPVIFLILLLPAGLFLGVTRTLAGALLGLMVGSVIGLMMGIIPGFVFIGIVIALAAIAFIARNQSG